LEKGAVAFKECKYAFGVLECNFWLACCYRRTANYTLYGKHLSLMEDDAKRLNNQPYLARTYEGYGNLYRYIGHYSNSIENYTKAITISEKLGNLNEEAVALNNLSLVYGMLGQTAEELKIELRTYKIIQGLKDSANMVLCLSNLSSLYQAMNKMDTARKCIDRAMNIIKIKGEANINFKDAASVYGQYSTFASANKDFTTAVEYQNKNINLSKQNGDIKTVASGYISFTDIFLLIGQKTFAEEYYLKSLDINKEIGFINGQMTNYQSLQEFYKLQKNLQKAELYAKEYAVLKDSLAVMTNQKKLMEAEALYAINEQRQEIATKNLNERLEQLKRERKQTITYVLTTALIVVLLIGLVLFIRYHKKV